MSQLYIVLWAVSIVVFFIIVSMCAEQLQKIAWSLEKIEKKLSGGKND